MSKSQEIAALRAFSAELGAGSYCGPWLTEQLPQIERAIISDFLPSATARSYCEAREQAAAIIAAATAQAAGIITAANEQAAAIITTARERGMSIGAGLADAIRAAERAMNNW